MREPQTNWVSLLRFLAWHWHCCEFFATQALKLTLDNEGEGEMGTRFTIGAALVAGLLLWGLGTPADAGFFSSTLTPGVDNRYEDNSREAFFDNPGGTPSGTFGVGDVILGF